MLAEPLQGNEGRGELGRALNAKLRSWGSTWREAERRKTIWSREIMCSIMTTGEQIGSGQMGGGGAEGSVEGLERWEGGKDSMPWPDQASAHGMRVGLLSESKCKS